MTHRIQVPRNTSRTIGPTDIAQGEDPKIQLANIGNDTVYAINAMALLTVV